MKLEILDRLHRCATVLAASAACLCGTACSTIDTMPAQPWDPAAKWVLLPLRNHTETPQAGLRADAVVESLVRIRRPELTRYPADLNPETLFEQNDVKLLERSLAWARAQGARYAVTGMVDEWRYKVGVDGEPAVGLTLQVLDVESGRVLWNAVGAKTGFSRESVAGVAQKLAREMLEPVTRPAGK